MTDAECLRRAGERPCQSRSEDARSPENTGDILMKWPWRRRAELCEPRIGGDSKLMELETAKEILAEIFHTQTAEVEEMIQIRLEERNWPEEKEI